jgi:hypothetical protein
MNVDWINQSNLSPGLKTDKKDQDTFNRTILWVIEKEITINLYAPNVNAPNFIKHTLKHLKAYINSNTVELIIIINRKVIQTKNP